MKTGEKIMIGIFGIILSVLFTFLMGSCDGGGKKDGEIIDIVDMDAGDIFDSGKPDGDEQGDNNVSGEDFIDFNEMDMTGNEPTEDEQQLPDTQGCPPEACNDYCNSIGLGPGECVEGACYCRGSSDAFVDPDVPEDGEEIHYECIVDGDCDDHNICTYDACAPATHTCFHQNIDYISCDDGLWCNGTDVCLEGICVPASEEPCRTLEPLCQSVRCDEDRDECVFENAPNGTPCDDGLWCNGPDICQDGFCQRPGPFPCPIASSDPCKMPRCDEEHDVCLEENKPDGANCQDEFACNGVETCQGGVCVSGTPYCDDGNRCTEDICTEGPTPTCQHNPIPGCS